MRPFRATPNTPNPATPASFGRYRVVRELGRGAQGRVSLAEDTQLGRQVAIKTLASGTDPAHKASLIGEARTISRLSHPNIVTLYDLFEDQGMHCVVLEFVEGTTLEQVIRSKGALAPERACAIAAQVLDALAYAHERGIVHRDIKPANILIDAAGNARVMDFGIAAAAGKSQSDTSAGTPRYMAPETLDRREIARSADVFSVGMTLYEMLTGRAAIEGRNVFEVLHKIANEAFASPSSVNPEVSEGLDQIVMRALAKSPESRYTDAQEMRVALEALCTAQPADPAEQTPGPQAAGAIEFLLARMRHKSSFPALSNTISSINRITSGGEQSIQALTDVLLKDFSLTNRLLRMVNSTGFGQFGGTISTVSRAALILGFDAVRNLAITLVLFEHLQNKGQATKLRDDVIRSLYTGILARRISRIAGVRDPEEAFICGVFHNLGRVLTSYYLFDEALQITRQMQQSGHSEEQAAQAILGVTYPELGVAVARSWNLPETLVRSIARIGDARPQKPRNATERIRMVAALSESLTQACCAGSPAARDRLLSEASARFSAALDLDERALATVSADAMSELTKDTVALLGDSRGSRFCQLLKQTAGESTPGNEAGTDTLDRAIEDTARLTSSTEGAETSEPAQVLAAGVQDITNTLVGDFKLSGLLQIILETMYRAMGFSRVLLFMRDARQPAMVARLGYGADIDRIVKALRLPLDSAQDVFSVVLSKNVDVLVSDIDAENIRSRIPAWFRKSGLGQTFVVLPVVIDGKPIGLFYAEKSHAAELVISAREMNLLRTLRNQALLAFKQKR